MNGYIDPPTSWPRPATPTTMGGHFMRARDEGAFPVRYFFDFRPASAA